MQIQRSRLNCFHFPIATVVQPSNTFLRRRLVSLFVARRSAIEDRISSYPQSPDAVFCAPDLSCVIGTTHVFEGREADFEARLVSEVVKLRAVWCCGLRPMRVEKSGQDVVIAGAPDGSHRNCDGTKAYGSFKSVVTVALARLHLGT